MQIFKSPELGPSCPIVFNDPQTRLHSIFSTLSGAPEARKENLVKPVWERDPWTMMQRPTLFRKKTIRLQVGRPLDKREKTGLSLNQICLFASRSLTATLVSDFVTGHF